MYRKLFVPIDGSEVTPRAIAASIELAQQLDAALFGFMAVPQPPLPGIGNLLDKNYRLHGSGVDAPGWNAFANLRFVF